MKFKFLVIFVLAALFLLVLATAVLAQEEPPGPYTGLKNPFPWDDTSAQESGKEIYQQSCSGCHGAKGSNLAETDFSAANYPQRLEQRPAFYFWILSEGRMDRGMLPFKSVLSEEQRWQVITYMWSLGAVASPPEVTPPPTETLVVEEGNVVRLSAAPQQPQSGQPLTLTAVLQDDQGKPIGNTPVKFLIRVDFFTDGLMEIGEALTNDQGVAVFEYTPRLTGEIQVVAHHGRLYTPDGQDHEAAITLNLAETERTFYTPEAGIRFPFPGNEVFIGPESALELGEMGEAPTSAFRLPGGILSWLLLLVVAVMLIWFTYFRVMYQVFRIPAVGETGDTTTRLVPLVGLAIVVVLGVFLILMLLTGPYSHFHLLQ